MKPALSLSVCALIVCAVCACKNLDAPQAQRSPPAAASATPADTRAHETRTLAPRHYDGVDTTTTPPAPADLIEGRFQAASVVDCRSSAADSARDCEAGARRFTDGSVDVVVKLPRGGERVLRFCARAGTDEFEALGSDAAGAAFAARRTVRNGEAWFEIDVGAERYGVQELLLAGD